MGKAWRWVVAHHSFVLAVVIAVTGAFSTIAAPKSPSNWKFAVPAGVGLLCVMVQAWLANSATRRARSAREEFQVVVGDQLAPLTRELSTFAAAQPHAQRERLSGLLQLAVTACTGLADPDARTRASFMKRELVNGVDTFVPQQHYGRADSPKSSFAFGTTDESCEVWRRALADEETFVVDLRQKPPAGWDPARHREYRTFITVPVRAGDGLVGLLTINSVEPGDLSDTDVMTMRIIAALIGAAIGMVGDHRAGTPQGPQDVGGDKHDSTGMVR